MICEEIMRPGHTEVSHAWPDNADEGARDLRLNVAVIP
jgi:hypothetical protein